MGVTKPAAPPHLTSHTAQTDQVRTRINRLDQDISLLRNRAQITPATRAKMNALSAESAKLFSCLPELRDHQTRREHQLKVDRQKFDQGHALYLKYQAPSLRSARTSLNALLSTALPPRLEKSIISLISDLDHHDNTMAEYVPSQGVPASMKRLIYACAK